MGNFVLYFHRNNKIEYDKLWSEGKDNFYLVKTLDNSWRQISEEDIIMIFKDDVGKESGIKIAKEKNPEYFI